MMQKLTFGMKILRLSQEPGIRFSIGAVSEFLTSSDYRWPGIIVSQLIYRIFAGTSEMLLELKAHSMDRYVA